MQKKHPPFFNRQYQNGENTNQNQMNNICLFLYCISSFEGTSYKNL